MKSKDEVIGIDVETKRRNLLLSSLKDKNNIENGRQILKEFGYNPISLCSECINNDFEGIEYGVDDILITEEIPECDPLNFKQVKPFNKDYFSIDYRSNNFGINNIENDGYIFVKLMEFLPKKWYNKEVLLKKQRKGIEIKIKGILSERNPDYLLLIRNTSDKPREHIPKHSLINAYFLPVETLKLQVINYLNIIREINEEQPLELDKSIIDSVIDIYQTWKLYDKRKYNFELIKMPNYDRGGKPDLFMKISNYKLLNYIKFDLNG